MRINMKRRFFESHIAYVGMLLCIGSIFLFGWFLKVCTNLNMEESDAYIMYASRFIAYASIVFLIWMIVFRLWERQDWLLLTEESVTWRCLLKKSVQITYDDCQYIGVETFNKESFGVSLRGDRFAMIYISLDLYPEEMSGHINRLHCNERFIKFPYTDKLAETLLEVAPQEKTHLLRAFYNQMKRYDQELEQNRKRRKKRKK